MLSQTDRCHTVEAGLLDGAVVAVTQVDLLVEPGVMHRPLTPTRLLFGQRDRDDLDPIVLGRVQREPAPSTAGVQHPHPRFEPQFAAHEVELLLLRLLERGIGAGEHRARVRHGRPQDPLVEAVGHVVVVGDHLGVPAPGVLHPLRADLLGRWRWLLQEQRRELPGQSGLLAPGDLPHRRGGQTVERRVEVAGHIQVARHVGARQTQLPGRPEQGGDRPGGSQLQSHIGADRSALAAVVGHELHTGVRAGEHVECFGDLHQASLQVLSYRSGNRPSGSYCFLSTE